MIAHKTMTHEPALHVLPKRKYPMPVWNEPDEQTVELFRRKIVEIPVFHALRWQDWRLGYHTPWRYWDAELEKVIFPRPYYTLHWKLYVYVGVEHYQQQYPRSAYNVRTRLARLLAGWGWVVRECTVEECHDPGIYAAHRKPRLFDLFETKG